MYSESYFFYPNHLGGGDNVYSFSREGLIVLQVSSDTFLFRLCQLYKIFQVHIIQQCGTYKSSVDAHFLLNSLNMSQLISRFSIAYDLIGINLNVTCQLCALYMCNSTLCWVVRPPMCRNSLVRSDFNSRMSKDGKEKM